jgi:hypothetical protein
MEDDLGLRVLNNKMRRVKFKKDRVVKGKLFNRKKIFTNGGNPKKLFKNELTVR